MVTLVLAIWIGVESLGIDATRSYDFNGSNECEVFVACGAGIEFASFSYDVDDLGLFGGIERDPYSLTAWSTGHLDLGVNGLSYNTETGYTWMPETVGHFLFLQGIDGDFWVAIEDMPVWAA